MRGDRDAGAAGGLGLLPVRRDRRGAAPEGGLLDQRPAQPPVRKAIDTIPTDAWTKIKYTNAVWDEHAQAWISDAEVAEIEFTAFSSKAKAKQVTARLIVRRVPDVNPANQNPLFTVYRHHAVFTNSPLPVLQAEKTHRAHEIVEQVIADLKGGPLAHLPSGKFSANSAWLVCAAMSFNLTRTAGAAGRRQTATSSSTNPTTATGSLGRFCRRRAYDRR